MLVTKKMLLALTLVGALVGAGIGTLITRTTQSTSAANTTEAGTVPVSYNEKAPEQIAATNATQYGTTEEQTAYRAGFDAGYAACSNSTANTSNTVAYRSNVQPTYRATRRYSNSRRVYYDYGSAPRGRSFWQKHRDKLTLAMGTGLGAAIGGLAGGKKGAGIGALAGLGGSALYTYKLRHRTRRY